MLDRVRQAIRREGLLEPNDKVVVGVSGGADSMALLHSLMVLQKDFSYRIHVAHLNHQLRTEAGADAQYVCRIAKSWGLPVTVASRNVLAYQKEKRLSLEAAAREIRYNFLQAVADKVGANKIAVGHQADDQAETVLLNLLRGSGLTGLKAMLPRRSNLIRPLLLISRGEIETYCDEQGIEIRQDITNVDPVYRRNKIRHLLVPLLAREFNPKIINTLGRTAIILQEDEEFLRKLTREAFDKLRTYQDPDRLILDRQGWLLLETALQCRTLRCAAEEMGIRIDFNQVEEARDIIGRQGFITWPQGLQVHAQDTKIAIQVPVSTGLPKKTVVYQLQVPGLTPLPELSQAIRAEIIKPPFSYRQKDEKKACLDWDKLKKPLLVRNWQPGDWFRPLGMAGRKKLHDFFIDMGLPLNKRCLVPLLLSGGRIAWVAGLRLADDFKITAATQTALYLQLESWSKK